MAFLRPSLRGPHARQYPPADLDNIFFCVFSDVYVLYSLEAFFFNLYYLTVVGYVCQLYMNKNKWNQKQSLRYTFIVLMTLMGVLYTTICIVSIVYERTDRMVNDSC
jgi:hypothetical protein